MKTLLLLLMLLLPATASAAVIDWADWSRNNLTGATETATATLGTVNATITGPMMLAPLIGLPGEPNYFAGRAATYTSPLVENLPGTSDLMKFNGQGTYTVVFSEPVTDPVMAVVSLGGVAESRWDFTPSQITVLQTGPGAFGNKTPMRAEGTVLIGNESNGLVLIHGTGSAFQFTIQPAENWGGMTIGLQRVSVSIPQIPVTLTWDAPPIVKNLDGSTLELSGYRLHRAQGEACSQPEPLPATIAIPPVLTYHDTVPAVLGEVCYELTSLAGDAESVHSNRASATIGAAVPNAPLQLRITIP